MNFPKASNNDKAIAAHPVAHRTEGLHPSERARLASAIHSNVGASRLLHGETPRMVCTCRSESASAGTSEHPAVRD